MDKENNKQTLLLWIVSVFVAGILVAGGTYAYLSWQTSASQKTMVTFTVRSNFSCAADGGGNITSADKKLVPTDCTDTTYAIQRTVTVSPTITQANKEINLDLWLKVNSIDAGLSASQNFKYALTTSSTSCTTGVVAQGNFNGATTNTKKTLLHEKAYSSTTTDTYYLWIWLDAAETDSATQNQSFNIELGGLCTDDIPNYVYTANLYDKDVFGYNEVWIGSLISNNITQYATPEAAMTALKTAWGGTTDYPFFLRQRIANGTIWCANNSEYGNSCDFGFSWDTEEECENYLTENNAEGFTCELRTASIITESYVGFVVTPEMATNNPGMTAGTYYLKGGDNGVAYEENKAILLSAFGSSNCWDNSSIFDCSESGLYAYVSDDGYVVAHDGAGSICHVYDYGASDCN